MPILFFSSNDGFLFCSITYKLPKKWGFPITETTKSTAAKFYCHLLKVRRYLRRQLPIAVINSGGCLLLWINFQKRNFKHVLCLDQANIYLFKVNNKNKKKVYNISKVNNKNTRTTSVTSFQCLHCYLWTHFIPFLSEFIVDFEHVK